MGNLHRWAVVHRNCAEVDSAMPRLTPRLTPRALGAVLVCSWVLVGCDGPSASPPSVTSAPASGTPTYSSQPIPTDGEPVPTRTGPGTNPSGSSTSAVGDERIKAFRERCLAETRTLDEADLRYEKVVRLDDGEQTRFEVSLTSPTALPTASAPPVQGKVQLACTVEARLIGSNEGVDIAPSDWVPDQYVPPDPTSWTWLVRATAPGDVDAVLQLRPAILVGAGGTPTGSTSLGTVDFAVTFSVSRTISDTAGLAWGWIVGLVGFVAALLGIPPALRALRQGRNGPSPPPDTAGGAEGAPSGTGPGGRATTARGVRAKRPRRPH